VSNVTNLLQSLRNFTSAKAKIVTNLPVYLVIKDTKYGKSLPGKGKKVAAWIEYNFGRGKSFTIYIDTYVYNKKKNDETFLRNIILHELSHVLQIDTNTNKLISKHVHGKEFKQGTKKLGVPKSHSGAKYKAVAGGK